MSKNPEFRLKVRLKEDLTRYNKGLKSGIEGVTVGRQGMWSRGQDRFITVKSEGITTLDVLWSGLEIIDEVYLLELERRKQQFQKDLKTAKNVKLTLGPKGGFKSLSIEYESEGHTIHSSYGSKEEAYDIIEVLKNYKIPIVTVKESLKK